MARRRTKRPHGFGSIYFRGASWVIRYREGGKRMTERFVDREVAERVLARITGGLSREEAGLKPDTRAGTALSVFAASWLEERKKTHLAAVDDISRWTIHLGPFFGGYRPDEVDKPLIRRFVLEKLAAKLSSTSVGHLVRLLSSLFTRLVEDGHVNENPVKNLPRATKRLIRNAHDPKDTPFLRTKDDIRRVFLELCEPYNVMFAVGALAGLRTGEVIGLFLEDVDLKARQIHVRRQVQDGELRQVKDKESRIAPILDSLFPIVRDWLRAKGTTGLMFRPKHPARGGRPELGKGAGFIRQHTLSWRLAKALDKCGLQKLSRGKAAPARAAALLNWYRCTRHTFASHWVMDGRSMEQLRLILGHEDLTTTMRYAHLAPGSFTAADLAAVAVDLSPATGKVIPLAPRAGSDRLGTVGHDEGREVVSEAS